MGHVFLVGISFVGEHGDEKLGSIPTTMSLMILGMPFGIIISQEA